MSSFALSVLRRPLGAVVLAALTFAMPASADLTVGVNDDAGQSSSLAPWFYPTLGAEGLEYDALTLRWDDRSPTTIPNRANLAQAQVSYHQFRANLIAAEASLLTREGTLRNILGLPPSDDRRIYMVSYSYSDINSLGQSQSWTYPYVKTETSYLGKVTKTSMGFMEKSAVEKFLKETVKGELKAGNR